MKQVQSVPKKRVLTSALLFALAGPAWAQQAEPQSASPAPAATEQADPTELDTIVVTGIRASLESSMNLKRDAQGVVDGIVAEDIGKFRTPTWPSRCSASPAYRSTVPPAAKVRRSRCAA